LAVAVVIVVSACDISHFSLVMFHIYRITLSYVYLNIRTVTSQGSACDAASVHFGATIRTDLLYFYYVVAAQREMHVKL